MATLVPDPPLLGVCTDCFANSVVEAGEVWLALILDVNEDAEFLCDVESDLTLQIFFASCGTSYCLAVPNWDWQPLLDV